MSSNWQKFLQSVRRVTLMTILTMGRVFVYTTQSLRCVTLVVILMTGGVLVVITQDGHPGLQLPFNPVKKTVAVVGSRLQGHGRWHERTRGRVGWQRQQR